MVRLICARARFAFFTASATCLLPFIALCTITVVIEQVWHTRDSRPIYPHVKVNLNNGIVIKISLILASDWSTAIKIVMNIDESGFRLPIYPLQVNYIVMNIEVQHDLYLCFIDYAKAFDKVKHEDLFEFLQNLDIDGKDLRLIRNLYWEQSAAIRIDGNIGKYTQIRRGVRQGCVFSPDLFNLYSENILRDLNDIKGCIVGGAIGKPRCMHIYNIIYAVVHYIIVY